MIYIEQSTLDKARENAEKALEKFGAMIDGPAAARREAWEAYKRAASDYRTLIRASYNL